MALSLDYSGAWMELAQIPEDHESLIEAIEAGDEDVAVERLVEHIVKSVDPLIARLCEGDQAQEFHDRLLRGL
jgi:DNA-binding GntR family transcriptional regulator